MSGLEALDAVRERRAKKEKPPWVRPPFAPTHEGYVLALDPSLASTGWAIMSAEHPYVHEVGTITTKPLDGKEGNIRRAVAIHSAVHPLLDRLYALAPGTALMERREGLVAHEAPPGGSGLRRADSIESASIAIRIAADTRSWPTHMVSDLTAKKRMVGRSKQVTKAEIAAALAEFWPHLPLDGMRWNEHIRDAVLIGIITLEEYHHGK